MSRKASESLDEVDLRLIREFEIDARQTYLDIADKLGTSATTVSRRLQRLLKSNIIRVCALTNPMALGYAFQANFGINVAAQFLNKVAGTLASMSCVQYIFIATGRFDLIVTVLFKNMDEFRDFLLVDLANIPQITQVESMVIVDYAKSSWTFLGDDRGVLKHRPFSYKLDETDLLLIKELELSPRQTVSDLSLKLGISRSGVHRKLQALLDEGCLRIVSIPNHRALGFELLTATFLRVSPSKVQAVAEAVAGFPQVQHVLMTAGRFDLTIWAVFHDVGKMTRFMREDMGAISGITHIETTIVSSMAKSAPALLA